MARIGEFGRARAELAGEPDTFTFYGEEFEVPAGISAVVLMDFVADTQAAADAREDAERRREQAQARLGRARTDVETLAAQAAMDAADRDLISSSNTLMRAMRAYVRSCLPDEGQWQRFNATCRARAVDVDELMDVAAAIFAAVAARPTRQPSDSSDGLSTIGGGSTDGAGSPDPTGGPRPPGTESPALVAEVVEMTPLERQRAEARARMVSVDSLLASGD